MTTVGKEAEAVDEPTVPEITVKAVVLGVVLSVLLAGANAYLGLMAGMTVSASIPAAVISMAVLRLFRRSNILENNIVQTAASAGESLAAGVVFTLPALILLGAWTRFDYWQTTAIAGLGGLLGVLFTVPLRRALIVEAKLKFPEGVATAQVLEVGGKGRLGVLLIAAGGALGAVSKLCRAGVGLWKGSVEVARSAGSSVVYFGADLGPALVAVGFIVGLNIAVLVFLGGALNWYVAIPLIAADAPLSRAAPLDRAWAIWSEQTRYLGVGAMVIGGLWAIVRMAPNLVRGIRSSLAAHRQARATAAGEMPRTERDAPLSWVGIALVVSVVPLFFLFRHVTGSARIGALLSVVMLVAAFLFSAVASYMAGLVGSSNNPISGVTLATILASAALLLALGIGGEKGPAAAILVGAVVCCAAAIGGDNLQDLKTGHLVGATPWKQQVMQAVGVAATAVVIAPILTLLINAYGIGPGTVLKAPQATLFASVAQGIFDRDLPWGMVLIGMDIAAMVIAVDWVLEQVGSRFRMPVLAVAVGIYLPLELGISIFAGGLIAWVAGRVVARRKAGPGALGVLLAAGLITGEALVGILLAIPIVLMKRKIPFPFIPPGGPWRWPSVVLLLVVFAGLLVAATRRREGEATGGT